MPATPSQLRRPVIVAHTVDFGDGVMVRFTYDRNKITDAWINDWTAFENDNAAPQLNGMLADLIDGWDVQNDDGSPYPKTPENIGYLFALPDKSRIFTELVTASVPSDAEGKASSAQPPMQSSDSADPQPTSQNGQVTFPSPVPSASPSLT